MRTEHFRRNDFFKAVVAKHPHLEPIGEHLIKVPRDVDALFAAGKIGYGGEIDHRVKGLKPDTVIPISDKQIDNFRVGRKVDFDGQMWFVGAKIGFLVPESGERGAGLGTQWIVYLFMPERILSH